LQGEDHQRRTAIPFQKLCKHHGTNIIRKIATDTGGDILLLVHRLEHIPLNQREGRLILESKIPQYPAESMIYLKSLYQDTLGKKKGRQSPDTGPYLPDIHPLLHLQGVDYPLLDRSG